jgi:2-iminobutanoate/2-iminopropanoate deaminase
MSAPLFFMASGAPTPVAPFSHAVEVDGWIFVTGQMPTWPDEDSRPLPPDIEGQTVRVMENLKIVLAGLKLGLEHEIDLLAKR